MTDLSSTLNEDKNINRSDPSRMYDIGQIPLARLRPEKLDDITIKNHISMIQEICQDTDPDVIALVFHECDYNLQNTIARIKTGNFEDGGWQTAKSNNKKKNHNTNISNDQILNSSLQSDSERSHSQRTSPTSSIRSNTRGHRQQEDYQDLLSNTTKAERYENDSSRNNDNKPISNEMNLSSKPKEDIIPPPPPPLPPISSSIKRSFPSSIPQKPVSMHRTVQFSTEPIDIQFGDVQWNDSIPIAVTPCNSPILTESSSIINTNDHEQKIDIQDNYINEQTTNEINRELIESTNQLSISSPLTNNVTNVPIEETSHLSDHLTDSLQQQTSSSSIIDTTQLTSNTCEYPSPTSQQQNNSFISNTFQPSLSNTSTTSASNNFSAFTPYNYNTPGVFQSVSRDYPQTSNYKITSKPSMIQSGNYPQQTSYQLPPQQQFFVGSYPYPTQTFYPIITPVEPWSPTGYEPYSAYSTNYISTYPTQQQYHHATVQSPKYDQYSYDKDFFANYGPPRLSNNDLSNSSQTAKDAAMTSKLSPIAASFSQGAPVTTTSPGTAFYFNPVLYALPTYPSHQDRTMSYSSVDTRDNRHGASYGGNNNRNHYYQQQRTHNNSTWHSQQ